MTRKTRALGAELTCLCLVRFDTLCWIDWRLSQFYSKNKRKLKEH